MKDITELFGSCNQEEIFIVGTGPSLARFDYSRLNQKITIALNDAVFQFNPTYHLFSDVDIQMRYCDKEAFWQQPKIWTDHKCSRPRDWSYHPATTIVVQDSVGEWLLNAPKEVFRSSQKACVHVFRKRGPDVALEAAELWCRNTVAATGLQLAWKLGAGQVYLLGIDGYSQGGCEYCYESPDRFAEIEFMRKRANDALDFDEVIKNCIAFGGKVPSVINLNPESLIGCFPRVPTNVILSKG